MRRITASAALLLALTACSPTSEDQAGLACEKFREVVTESASGDLDSRLLGGEFIAVQTRAEASDNEALAAGAVALLAAVEADDDQALADAVAAMGQACTDAGH